MQCARVKARRQTQAHSLRAPDAAAEPQPPQHERPDGYGVAEQTDRGSERKPPPATSMFRTVRLCALLLATGASWAAADKMLLNIHRVEVRVADPDTQCDNNPDWLVDMEDATNYGGLLEFGIMEETGFFSMAGYDFE